MIQNHWNLWGEASQSGFRDSQGYTVKVCPQNKKKNNKKNQVVKMALNKQVFQLYLMCFSDAIYSGGEVMAAGHKEQETD